LPDGYFLAGRIEEELGRFKEAETNYRAAIKAHGKNDAEGSRYYIALARVLLKQIAKGSARLAAPSAEAVALERAALRRGVSIEALAVLSLLTLQAGDLPGDRRAASAEADKIADAILALGDKAPFDARAQALAIKGLHTRALQVYTAGLRDSGVLPAEYANTLLDLINDHPILKRPESLVNADPTQAEKYYASGLGFYNDRKYASAEKEFLSAVENDKADARYYYFLGLSRLAQDNRDAYEDFEQAARLEQRGKPGRAAVSAALERVQGPPRAALNEVRTRPIRERSK
jgi:tetratricopeptide (TPR) repeat protein